MPIKVNERGYIYDTDGAVWLPPLNQKQFEIFNEYRRYVLVHGPRLSGKCVSSDTIVRTDGGLCRIRKLVPFGKDGESIPCKADVISANLESKTFSTATVVESWKEPSKASKEVRCYRGYSVTCSPWHPLWVRCGSVHKWMTSGEIEFEIKTGSDIWIPVSFGHKRWLNGKNVVCNFLPNGPRTAKDLKDYKSICAAAERGDLKTYRHYDNPHNWNAIARETGLPWTRIRQWSSGGLNDPTRSIAITEDVGYFIAIMIGDGCCTPKAISSHFVGFADGDGVLSEWMRGFLMANFPESTLRHRGGCNYAVGGKSLLGFVSFLGMCRHAHEKKIPDQIVESPKQVVRAFLSGLFDTDGTADKLGRVSFCSSSAELARDVQRLLVEFGIESRLRFKPNRCRGAWILDLVDHKLFYREIGFRLQRKQDRYSRLNPKHSSRRMKPNEPGDTFDGTVKWQQVSSVVDCSAELFDISVPEFSNFVGNGMINHNTFGVIHKVIRHAFDTNGAMAAVVCKTLKNAKSSGVWPLLEKMLRIWSGYKDAAGNIVPGCPGFKVVEGPKTTGDTKMSFVRIRNRHGTISEIQCHSLEHAQEVEAKFKGSNYSMFWLSEIDQYCTEHAFDIFCDALRMTPFIPFEQHQIVCDCNPPDTGPNNWLHDRWFKFKDAEPASDETEKAKIARDRICKILVMIDDNPQLDQELKDDLIERYRKRPAWYARFVLGLWEQDITGGHFSDVWDEDIHVIGSIGSTDEETVMLTPTPQCTTLLTGWDMGTSKNHSFHILEKITSEIPGTNRKVVSFSVLDELVVIRTHISINQFTEAAMAKMDFWIAWMKQHHNLEIKWRHWSDSSAFQYRAAANSTDAAMVYEASGGRIVLDAAPKYRNSNRDKVKLLWQLLYAKRLHVSAQLEKTRAMFANLREGGDAEYVKEDDHKHPFDTVAYPLLAETPSDMLKSYEVKKQETKPAVSFSASV